MNTAVVTLSDDTRLPHVRRQVAALRRWSPGITHYRGQLGGDRNLARTRNATAQAALDDGAEFLVFLDADCIPGPGLVSGYIDAARQRPGEIYCGPVTYLDPPPEGGYRLDELTGQTSPHRARPNPSPGELVPGTHDQWDLFWSLSFAVDADTWRAGGGFDESYTGYGGEDTDFAYRQRELGQRLCWVGGAHAYHQWHPVSSPPWEHLDDILANAARFHRKWGVWPMGGWLDAFEQAGAIEFDGERWRRR
ncbi:glycosyltransferase family 2 protein [Corynebacterium doosanense]|uniref:Galactosyltransferase C-terminal domain-containing protein n=1 Tax=Corynebacterium doosanense CAU 212 = DSM 45436 TaxID=558173 RepID=A0A097IFK6_9CORY|nr:galactosyltransferase-related protein [Corynebacterium doosanense]AIT60895.1 hypothetical protein CDOO_06220 [Corynebacterium doosanense CAU 212 = DSM 45436]